MMVRRAGAATLCVMALLASRAPLDASSEDDRPASRSEASRAAEKKSSQFALKASLESRYDDNILQLSESAKRQLEENPDPDQFLIETADDVIAIGRLDFRWAGRPISRRKTSVALSLDAYRHARNDVKDYEEYGISISQEITASRRHLGSMRLEASRTPGFYMRQLTDDDASFAAMQRIREAATFAQNDYRVAYRQEIVSGRLEGRLGWRSRARDFNDHFNERDNTRRNWLLGLQGCPFGRAPIEVTLSYEIGTLRARGDLPSTPIPDDDISYRYHALILETEIPWQTQKRGRLQIEVRRENRDFTSSNPFDISHSERQDRRRDYQARVVQRLASGLDLVGEVRRRSNDASFPVPFTDFDEETDFVENRVSVGLSWNIPF